MCGPRAGLATSAIRNSSAPAAASASGRSRQGRISVTGATGSTNLAEFFVTLTISATFIATVGLELWPTIAGLVLGGVLAAPFAAYITQKLPDRPLMILVGVVIVLLSLRGLL